MTKSAAFNTRMSAHPPILGMTSVENVQDNVRLFAKTTKCGVQEFTTRTDVKDLNLALLSVKFVLSISLTVAVVQSEIKQFSVTFLVPLMKRSALDIMTQMGAKLSLSVFLPAMCVPNTNMTRTDVQCHIIQNVTGTLNTIVTPEWT